MSSWIKGIIGFALFFGMIGAYVIEAEYLNGYLDLAGLIKNGLLTGALIGGVAALLLSKKGKDQDGRFSIFAGVLVLGVVLGPLLLSWSNRLSSGEVIAQEFEVISIRSTMQSSFGVIKGQDFKADAHKLTIAKDSTRYDVKIGADLNSYIIDDKTILLNIRPGGLGYDYIQPSKDSDEGQARS